jgi:hypothetical protein
VTTILARDLKRDDVIDFGGQPVTLTGAPYGRHVSGRVNHIYVPWELGGGWFPEDLPLNVQRPDPDAELIEVMARAAYLDDGCSESRWPFTPASETYRGNIRAALSAAREAGLL